MKVAPHEIGRGAHAAQPERGVTGVEDEHARLLDPRDGVAPVRGWLEASAVVDGIGASACLLARDYIRTSVFPGAVGLAAVGALLSARLARQLDPAQSPP